MDQMTIFDFTWDDRANENQADPVILERIQSTFPGWEALGYNKSFDWGWCEDYTAIIRRGDEYVWVSVELYKDGRVRVGYTQRRDFEPHWFEKDEKKGKHWVWRSLDDRNRVFEIARQKRGVIG